MTSKTNKTILKVIEKYEPERTEFENKKDFEKYASAHLSEMQDCSTFKLNKKFLVKGYRITKKKNEICLITDHYAPTPSATTAAATPAVTAAAAAVTGLLDAQQFEAFKQDLKLLDEKINYIVKVLRDNEIIPTV
jgi:hypothetical protein